MNWYRQFSRYVMVGLVSNLLLYLIFLFFNALGMEHKLAMSILYGLGVTQTFLLNKRWTFAHTGRFLHSMWRYFFAYLLCYMLNFFILLVLVDYHGLPPELVQGVAIILVALILFVVQKYWVFSYKNSRIIRSGVEA